MKNKVIPTNVEHLMSETDLIVSRTDMKGIITYCNEAFIKLSGFEREELIGEQHNIVRHPDMPRAIFKLLWDTLLGGNEITAYVKNMCKDGSYYWVLANVTVDHNEYGAITGCYSVRRKPHPSALQTVKELYRVMLEAERAAGSRDAMAASTKILLDVVTSHGFKTYDEFVFSIINKYQ